MDEIFIGELKEFIIRANRGTKDDVDFIFNNLTDKATLATTRYIDYALGKVENSSGIKQIEHYLFNGTLIQRNYSCLFFCRRYDYNIVDKAFKEGRIDEIQAYAR